MLIKLTSRISLLATLALICAAGSAGMVRAATLDEYQHRVAAAAALVEELHGAGEDERNFPSEVIVTPNLARLQQMLPPKETVTMYGEVINVDNTWLHEEIAAYQKKTSEAARAGLLARLAERLHALDERLQEIQQKMNTGVSDKDADKGRLAEIL